MSETTSEIRIVDNPDLQPTEGEAEKAKSDFEIIKRKTLSQMIGEFPDLRPVVIDGLLRKGEVANIIASPKMGKSYLAGSLSLAMVTGSDWLGHATTKGKVLIVDNELHPETTTDRLCRIASALMIQTSAFGDQIEVLSLRGALCDINDLSLHLDGIEPGEFGLIILDALYRTLPEGASENDNASMTAVFNRLDSYAAKYDCAFVVVHHSSKGDQSGKGVTDVGSGAGSIARAADTHLVIRPHTQSGHAVLEAVTRSWKSPDPISIEWNYPIWIVTTLTPDVRGPASAKAEAMAKSDAVDIETILKLMQANDQPIRQQSIIDGLPWGADKIKRLLTAMVRAESIGKIEKPEDGSKRIGVFYVLKNPPNTGY